MVNHNNLGMVIHKMMVEAINNKMGKVSHNMEVEVINIKGVVEVNSNNHLEDIVENYVHFV